MATLIPSVVRERELPVSSAGKYFCLLRYKIISFKAGTF